MKEFIVLIIIIFLSINSCKSQVNSSENQVDRLDLVKDKNWVNIGYLECLEKNYLPCECGNYEYILLSIKSNLTNKIKLISINNERENFVLEKQDSLNYNIYISKEIEKPLFQLTIKTDTLELYNESGLISKFINNKDFNRYIKDYELINYINLYNLKKVIQLKAENSQIINNNSTLFCNQELDEINLISEIGNCENMFEVEIIDNKIYIYKIKNSCDSKSIPIKIEKELIESFDLN